MKVLLTPRGLSDVMVDILTSELIMADFLPDKQNVNVLWCNDGKETSSQAPAMPANVRQQHKTSFERLWKYTNINIRRRVPQDAQVTVTLEQISFWDELDEFERKLQDCDFSS